MVHLRWQLQAIARAVALTPPFAGIVITLLPQRFADGFHFPQWESLGSFLFKTLLVTLPVSYAFGAVPALIGSVLYCAALSAIPGLRNRVAYRCAVAFVLGALVAASWAIFAIEAQGLAYGVVGAVAALLVAEAV